ncbi:HEAT repeat domain-containing protein [Deminuibacter soli]|uniref:HEAT repeat domain-containing protein n=1 Tax=Deminuibacter soli TaxID=2291815 RepID=A0A3E1NCJ5_9BACT|nr:HEAT repeat domain-containing protein [Deminuibacter soli]RFM25561.1 HEAT repeat domain-containing protein [Deminuibacter soli]
MMTDNEKELILELAANAITKRDFLIHYAKPVNDVIVLDGVEKACIEKDPEGIEYQLLLGFLFDCFTEQFSSLLCKLLGEEWHYKHEDIVFILQKLKSPNTVECLYNRALNKPAYMDYDDSYSLARKCIYALGDINTEPAREKLRLLATSDIPIIKEKAEKQLVSYNR